MAKAASDQLFTTSFQHLWNLLYVVEQTGRFQTVFLKFQSRAQSKPMCCMSLVFYPDVRGAIYSYTIFSAGIVFCLLDINPLLVGTGSVNRSLHLESGMWSFGNYEGCVFLHKIGIHFIFFFPEDFEA